MSVQGYLRAYIKATQSWGWSGGAEFSTRIVERINGRENRNADWSNARHKYSLSFQHLPKEVYRNVKRHHLVTQGALRPFLFRDGLDDIASDDLFAVATAGQQEFQLLCASTIDGITYERKVFALYAESPSSPGVAVAATPVVKVDDIEASGWVFDYDRGLATAPAPMAGGEVLTWSGAFSVWVRFEQDWLPFSYDEPNGIYGSIDLLEVPPPVVIGSPE